LAAHIRTEFRNNRTVNEYATKKFLLSAAQDNIERVARSLGLATGTL